MEKQKKILRSDIRCECGDGSYERGRSYFEKGLVVDLTIKSEGVLFVQLNAAVKGSDRSPYKQNIRIIWRPDFSAAEIEGYCSCPVGFNCKHVAAACLMYQHSTQPLSLSPIKGPSCLDWLDNLNEQMPRHNSQHDFIVYILKPGKTEHEFIFEFFITKEKKSGGISKGRKTTLNNLRYSFNYLNYIQPQDEEIAKLLSAFTTSFTGEPVLAGATGYVALTKLLQTGRLYWQDLEKPPLKAGDKRKLLFNWQQSDQDDYQLNVEAEPPALFLLTDPPQYLDTGLGIVGEFNTAGLSAGQLKKMLSAPLIPAQYADEFSQRLTIAHPALPLPAPKEVHLIELNDLTPVPEISLAGKQTAAQSYLHFIKVAFNYGEWTVPAFHFEDYSILKTDHGLVRIKRAGEAESKAIRRLTDQGFTLVRPEEKGIQEQVLFSPGEKSRIDSAARWRNFIQHTLSELEQEGWIITIEDSFRLNFQSAENWEAEIREPGNDWFEMRFNIEVNGQPHALLPLIMPVLENYDPENLPDILNLPISDHTYLTLPSARIKPFLNILYELFNSSTVAKDGTLKLSRYNAASLSDLEAQNSGLFTISGGRELRELGQKLKHFSGIQNVALPVNFHAELRNYQQHGLNWLQFLREYRFSGILADDMGLGKTLQTLVHLLVEKQQGRMVSPSLIIAPTSLMSNWRREAERFTPDLRVLTLQGIERKQLFAKIRDYDLVLTTYPLLPRDEETLLEHEYHYLILDEAQTIKNPLSKAAQLVRRIKSAHRLCLTGTPMENHLGELWAQFDFLMPGFLADSTTFKKIYRTPIENHGNTEQRSRLSRRIAPFMLRRTKEEVARELPLKTEIIRSVPLYKQQAALYESIRLTMEKKVREAIAQKGLARCHITILDALLKLRQTCCDPRTLRLKEAQKLRESAKLDLLMELVPEQLEEGRRLLVFSQFTRMIALIEEELNARQIGYSKLTGQTRNRDDAIEQFKSGEVNVFLISLKAGGVGLNLTEADTIIIYDPWWNPAVETQAADRAHRIGQDKPVFVYKLITENTVEEKILAMQERKRLLAESIYKDGTGKESLKLTAEDLTALFEPL
ncbi:SWIM zinc finger protein [Candidatus Methylobacter favarea]|uniref:SWIM zinc finger protein n=1 Tax=Candidatus Methylobacter favarea TaxID=2707345 RepID=A0A8S0WP46_9GAMM|nr:SNF2-related protein [Candidatus Methylobacter favarea]CAA9890735.1 SWIM zinc finger protein [Candidatus Methylobacter favarea]